MTESPRIPIDAERLKKAAEVLKTVAHPVRLQIIDLLESGESSVSELCRSLGVPQPYASQQLNLMKDKGVLSSRRSGTQVFYAVADPRVVKVIHCVRGQAGSNDVEPIETCVGAMDENT